MCETGQSDSKLISDLMKLGFTHVIFSWQGDFVKNPLREFCLQQEGSIWDSSKTEL